MISIRRGITRTVILTPRHAIKLPSLRRHGKGLAGMLWSFSRGISANLSEREWSGYSPALCPVRWSLAGLVNVYPRCEPVTEEPDDYYAIANMLGPMDKKPENLGILDGRMVWVDYAMDWNDPPPCVHVSPDLIEE